MRLGRWLTLLTVVAVAGLIVLPAAAQGGSATSPEGDADDVAVQASGYGPPHFVLERHDFLAQRFAEFFSRVRPLAGAPGGESSEPSGPPDHAGEPGPPDHAGRADGAGPPDHAGQPGPPPHASSEAPSDDE